MKPRILFRVVSENENENESKNPENSSVDLERGNPLAYPPKGTRDQSVDAKQAMVKGIFFFLFLFPRRANKRW